MRTSQSGLWCTSLCVNQELAKMVVFEPIRAKHHTNLEHHGLRNNGIYHRQNSAGKKSSFTQPYSPISKEMWICEAKIKTKKKLFNSCSVLSVINTRESAAGFIYFCLFFFSSFLISSLSFSLSILIFVFGHPNNLPLTPTNNKKNYIKNVWW